MAKQILILFLLVLASEASYAAFPLKDSPRVATSGISADKIKTADVIALKPNTIASSGGMFDGPWKVWNIIAVVCLGITLILALIILLTPSDDI
jgi:hypothetical protein